jgi:Tfp pilus assembly protein PilE
MKKHHYPFANTFVRLAIVLAILSTLSGLAYVLFGFFSMQAEIRAQRYQPDPELLELAGNLERVYLGTRERIAQTLEDPVLPESLPAVNFSAAIGEAQKQLGTAQPDALLTLAEQTQTSVNDLKEFHVAGFERAIQNLREALLQRVQELQQQFGQKPQPLVANPPAANTTTPNTPSPVAQSTRFRLFNDPVSSDRQRMNNLERVREFLNELRDQSKREESLDQIRRAQIYLTRAEAMLDLLQIVSSQTTGESTPPQVELNARTEEQMVSRAEELAAQLQQVKGIIRQSLYETWQVDEAISRLRGAALSDLQRAESSREQIRVIRNNALSHLGFALFITIATAFLILVLADFLRAFLNLSINSDRFAAIESDASQGNSEASTAQKSVSSFTPPEAKPHDE